MAYEIGNVVYNKKILAKELIAGKKQNYTQYTVECLNCHRTYVTTVSRLNSKGKTGFCKNCISDKPKIYKIGDIINNRLCYAIERDKNNVLLYCFRCLKCGKETKLRDPKKLKDGLACQGCIHRVIWNGQVFNSIADMAKKLGVTDNSLYSWAKSHNNDFSEYTIEWSKQYQLKNKDKRSTAKYKVGDIVNDYEVIEYNRQAFLNKEISGPYKVKCRLCGKISYKAACTLEKTKCVCKITDKITGKRINKNALKYKAGDIVGHKQIIEHIYNVKHGNRSMYKTKCLYCGKICTEYASQIGKKQCKCQVNIASRKYKVDDVIGDFKILGITGKKRSNGAIIYKALCQNCGKIHETTAKTLKSGYCWKCHKGLRPKTVYDRCMRYEKKRQELLKANNFIESKETDLLKHGRFIYKITNLVNGKLYIGQTSTCVQKRFDDHARQGLNGSSIMLIDLAIKKYGKDNFKVEIIDSDIKDQEELNLKEQYWIAKYNTCNKKIGYNITIGGNSYGLLKVKRKSPYHTKIIYEGVEYSSKQALANAYNLPVKTAIYRLNKYGTLNIPNPWKKFNVCVNGIEYNSLSDFANKFNQPINAVRQYYSKHKNLTGYFIERFKLTFSKRAILNFKKYVEAEKRLIKKLNNRVLGKPVILNNFKYKVGDIVKGKEILDIKASVALLKIGIPYTKYLYTVKCLKCGHICTYTVLDMIKENECKFCRDEKYTNKIIGPYKFLCKTDKKKSHTYLWECICLNCGCKTYKVPSDIESEVRTGAITGKYCKHCTPTHINILSKETRKKAAVLSKEAVAKQLVGQTAHYKHKGMPRHILLVHNKNTTTQWFCGQWRYKAKTYRKCSTNIWECIAFIIAKKIELGIWNIKDAITYLNIARKIIDTHIKLKDKYNSNQYISIDLLLKNFNFI